MFAVFLYACITLYSTQLLATQHQLFKVWYLPLLRCF